MDEKTEELRDIFMEVSEEGTVTERQEAGRGSLAGDEAGETERVAAVVAEMRDRYEFATDLDDDALVRVVRGYYGGETDTAVADDLGVSRDTVIRARLDLHLVRERDLDAPFELAALRRLLGDGATVAEAADELGVSESTVRKYRRVVTARNEARRVSERFRSEFEDALGVISEDFTTEATEDGLEDATDGMETNVSF
ncbi:helix-turn-helix domain-containing protein [Halosegnis marinus]|uniref:Helix-turn-helix domain-containing protein n=1 Tax=Halosegnis marinus TaxID=3034023 RepID=A0ABD5ZP50_9EURY|nr:helix-turn-helix domain-containing protein [Halosegnis sp. DT85]